jgi:hypothetical protein
MKECRHIKLPSRDDDVDGVERMLKNYSYYRTRYDVSIHGGFKTKYKDRYDHILIIF